MLKKFLLQIYRNSLSSSRDRKLRIKRALGDLSTRILFYNHNLPSLHKGHEGSGSLTWPCLALGRLKLNEKMNKKEMERVKREK